jgi:hypothetical protein
MRQYKLGLRLVLVVAFEVEGFNSLLKCLLCGRCFLGSVAPDRELEEIEIVDGPTLRDDTLESLDSAKFAPRNRPVTEPSQRPSAIKNNCCQPASRPTAQLSG